MEFFQQYENEDGLLEKLPSWVFVEWSAANSFVQPLNYPSNMLYSGTLAAAGRRTPRSWDGVAAGIEAVLYSLARRTAAQYRSKFSRWAK